MSKEEKIINIIQEVLGVDAIEITYGAHLIYDLGASESQLAEIVNRIEDTFSIILGFESFEMTVEDLLIVVFSEISEESHRMSAKPRPLHHSFVYKVLPALAFNEGLNLFWDLRYKKGYDYMESSPIATEFDTRNRPIKQGLDYLHDLWHFLSKDLGNNGIEPKGLDYEILEKSNRLMIIFHFPHPEAIEEAFYSLFIWNMKAPLNDAAYYFILEKGLDNKSVIGQINEKGVHSILKTYDLIFTPKQFIDVVLKDHLPREDRSIIDEEKDQTVNPQFLVDGLVEKEHIYLKIIAAVAHKLNLPASDINRNTSVKDLVKQDYIDIINEVYQMYSIDPKKHYLFIKQDVDRLVKRQIEQKIDCRLLVFKICQHFESRIAGDYDNPKALYLDYRSIIDLISQSSEYKVLYNFISTTYPSFITDNAEQKKIEDRDLLFEDVLKIPDKFLSHNYPVDPRALFICLVSVAIAYSRYSHSVEKAARYHATAIILNTKWGPFINPVTLEKMIHEPFRKKTKGFSLKRFTSSISSWLTK